MNPGFVISVIFVTVMSVCASKNRLEDQAGMELNMWMLSLGENECSDPPYGHCSFYTNCLEQRYHCGPSGYPISYGLKYCEKFKLAHLKLSTQGQSWMIRTMKCLQDTLIPEGTGGVGAVKTCHELKEKAFDSHARCYLDSGLCTLPPSDWSAIVGIVSLKTLFSSWEVVKEVLEATKGCLPLFEASSP